MKFSPSCMEAMWERWRSLALTHSRSHSSCTLGRCRGLSGICRHREGACPVTKFPKVQETSRRGTGSFQVEKHKCVPKNIQHLLCYQNKAESVTEIIRGSSACQVLPFTSANKKPPVFSPFKSNQTCTLRGESESERI